MGLNIKNKETEALINRLAKITGESLTGAVTSAVKEALSKREKSKSFSTQKIVEICEQFQRSLKKPLTSKDGDADLYDENGLPK